MVRPSVVRISTRFVYHTSARGAGTGMRDPGCGRKPKRGWSLLPGRELERPGFEDLSVDRGDPLVELHDHHLEGGERLLETELDGSVRIVVRRCEGRRRYRGRGRACIADVD